MEEDIKILEDLAETLNKTCENGICEASMSIEKLIKGYRELEERNKQCIKAGDLERAVGFLMNRNDLSNYIPKSKVEGKIEELNKNELLCKMNFENIKFTIEVLQELKEG